MNTSGRVDFANTLRGFAALAVIVSHYYGVFWTNRSAVEYLILAPALPAETHGIPIYVQLINMFSLLNWGAFGVALFFIISGFVIPFSLSKASWHGFVANRVLRIFPTYAIGFTFTLLALAFSAHYFGTEWPFTLKEILIHYVPGLRDLLWSRNIDGIIWTLEIEMKFYLVCALGIVWFRERSMKILLLPFGLLILALVIFPQLVRISNYNADFYHLAIAYITSSQYILYMFIGVMFNFMHRGVIGPEKGYALILLLFFCFCLHWWAGPHSASLHVAWSYGMALILFSCAYAFPFVVRSNKVTDFFADISYPMYVVHGLAGYVGLRILLENGVRASVSLIIVTLLCFVVSWLIHITIEKPSQSLSKLISARLSREMLVPNGTAVIARQI